MRVTVADPEPGSGASRAAAGMITPISEAAYAEKELFRLGRESQRRYPAFAAELTGMTGEPTGYRQAGTLQVAYDADDLAILGEYQALQGSFGIPARRLSARECRREEPMLDPSVRGGLLAPDDASVDPRLLTRALLAAAAAAGAGIIRQPAAEILSAGGRAAGARLADGTRILARWVVLAAGWSSGTIAGLPAGAAPPVRPVKGQILRLRTVPDRPGTASPGTGGPGGGIGGAEGPPGLLARSVRGIVRGSSVYLVPRQSGELVIGATQEELGTDTRVTAGGVWELLRDARTIVPGITELELTEAVAGLRPGTPDNAPVLGPAALPGLVGEMAADLTLHSALNLITWQAASGQQRSGPRENQSLLSRSSFSGYFPGAYRDHLPFWAGRNHPLRGCRLAAILVVPCARQATEASALAFPAITH